MNNKLVYPKVYIEKGIKRYDIHWNDNSTVEDDIIHENHSFLRGYFLRCFDSLADGEKVVCCLSSNTGTITNISKGNAERIEKLIKGMLFPLVEKRHREIIKYNNLPHVKLRDKSKGEML